MNAGELHPFGTEGRVDRLVDILRTSDVSYERTLDLVQRMPPLAARIVALANSKTYGGEMEIDRLDRAIVLLGKDVLLDEVARYGELPPLVTDMGGLVSDRLIAHQIAVSHAAALVARAARLPLEQEASLAGLLHDVGLHLALERDPIALREAVAASRASNSRLVEHERLHMETDHCEAGEELLRRWGLPDSIASAVGFHHDPLMAPRAHRYLTVVVYAAECLARRAGFADPCGEQVPVLESRILSELRLTEDVLDANVPILCERLQALGLREPVEV